MIELILEKINLNKDSIVKKKSRSNKAISAGELIASVIELETLDVLAIKYKCSKPSLSKCLTRMFGKTDRAWLIYILSLIDKKEV